MIYMAAQGSTVSGALTWTGLMAYTYLPTAGQLMNGNTISQSAPVITTPSFADPRGFLVVKPVAPASGPSVIWMTDATTGLYK